MYGTLIERIFGSLGIVKPGGSSRALRRMIAVMFVAGMAFLSTGCAGRMGPALEIGKPAPYSRFTLLSGEWITLDQYRGKPTVVIFWASTCSQSPKAVERLNRLVGRIGKQRGTFIAASLDKAETLEEIKEMIRLRDMDNLIHAMSGNAEYDEAYLALKGSELPYVLIVGADGTMIYAGTSVGVVEEFFSSR